VQVYTLKIKILKPDLDIGPFPFQSGYYIESLNVPTCTRVNVNTKK